MSTTKAAPGARQSKSEPDCYISPLHWPHVPPACRALHSLFPRGTPHAKLVAFFQHRVTNRTVRMWREGVRNPPQWALDLLAMHGDELAACARQAKAGDHIAAGRRSLQLLNGQRRARRT